MFYTGSESMGFIGSGFCFLFVCFSYDIIELIAHIYAAWEGAGGSIVYYFPVIKQAFFYFYFVVFFLSVSRSWFLKTKFAGTKFAGIKFVGQKGSQFSYLYITVFAFFFSMYFILDIHLFSFILVGVKGGRGKVKSVAGQINMVHMAFFSPIHARASRFQCLLYGCARERIVKGHRPCCCAK